MPQSRKTSKKKSEELYEDHLPVRLNPKLDRALLSYALAASAAGVGVMAMAEPAEARIVAMPVSVQILENAGIIQFDINNDGIPDFGLSAMIYQFAGQPPMGNFSSMLRIVPAQPGNEVWAVSSDPDECAVAVHAGMHIGGARPFKPGPMIMLAATGSETRGRTSHCAWNGASSPYLGLKFLINGEVHYAWARVTGGLRNMTLAGFAYETVPGKPIIAGATKEPGKTDLQAESGFDSPAIQQAGLGLLAMGSFGLVAWRRNETIQPPELTPAVY
jgi:hypothetical protein